MSIGIYDEDFMKYTYVTFSLEAMKLFSYYNKKRELVRLSPVFTPDMYTKFIYRKDFDDGEFNQDIIKFDNIEYGGLAFSNNKYFALPLDIELTIPTVKPYEEYKDRFVNNKFKDGTFKALMRAEHARLSLDGKTIMPDFEKQFKNLGKADTVVLHDYDLNSIEDGFEVVNYIYRNMGRRYGGAHIGTKFPIQVDNSDDMLRWTDKKASKYLFSIQYNGIMEDEALVDLLKTEKIGATMRQFEYNITSGFKNEQEVITNFSNIFKQVLYLRTQHQRILLKYNDHFFSNERWELLIMLINRFTNSLADYSKTYFEQKIKGDTLYNYIKCHKVKKYADSEPLPLDEIRELFSYLREHDYELFKMFYEGSAVELKGGEFQLCQ